MKISIIGASGFIGQNLVKDLESGFEIIAVSCRNEKWREKINDSSVYVNLVGKAHDHKGVATEQDYFYANVELAKEIFSEFLKSDAKLLIHISSLAALEEFESTKPLLEDDTANPQSLYGKSKREAEEYLLTQVLPLDKKLVILRPPMVHGAGDKGNLSVLYKLISKGIPYPLSSFENYRSFISVDNFSFFIKEIIKNQHLLSSGIFHISDNETVSTQQIIEIIKKVENKNVINLNIPKPFIKGIAKIGDILSLPLNTKRLKKMTNNLEVSNQKIKSALGIDKLPLSAEEGLIKTIKSFKKEK